MESKNDFIKAKTTGSMPFSAGVLGYLGLIPFIGLTCLMLFRVDPGVEVSRLLGTYSAIILSFLGGIHWGIATENSLSKTVNSSKLNMHLILSVIPSLLGWAGLIAPEFTGFCIIIFGFVFVLVIDLRIEQMDIVPDWYPRLRKHLTLIVIGCLVIASVLKF